MNPATTTASSAADPALLQFNPEQNSERRAVKALNNKTPHRFKADEVFLFYKYLQELFAALVSARAKIRDRDTDQSAAVRAVVAGLKFLIDDFGA